MIIIHYFTINNEFTLKANDCIQLSAISTDSLKVWPARPVKTKRFFSSPEYNLEVSITWTVPPTGVHANPIATPTLSLHCSINVLFKPW